MPKKRSDYLIFEEPLIDISMEPTEEVDPLFIDPTAESINNDAEEEFELNGFSIFSPKVGVKKSISSTEEKAKVIIKTETIETEEVNVKQEPRDPDDGIDSDFYKDDTDPVEALAQALDKVEFLCPKCTYRSTDKEDVTQHFVTSHRVFQIGIPRPCDKCDFIAKTVRQLAAHKKASHPRTFVQDNLPTLPTGEFKCPHCDFVSFHKNNVRSHMKVHTQDTVYTCDKCPYTAISRLNIENHSARHLLKKSRKWKFKCKHCGLLERTEKLLQRHLILHGEGEMVKCQLCSYKSPYNHIISMHTRICHGIVGKRSWDKEEKWKMRVRKSTRKCARKRYSFGDDTEDDFQEEFLELPMRKSRRGRKKKNDTSNEPDDNKIEEDKKEDGNDKTQEISNSSDSVEKVIEAPRRPTLEERLGRARELINKNLSRKKGHVSNDSDKGGQSKNEKEVINKTEVESDDKKKTDEPEIEESEGENHSNHSGSDEETDSADENLSEEEGSGSKEDYWSEEGADFYPDTAEESMQSFSSDKAHLESTNNSSHRDTENSMTDSESLSRAESTDSKKENVKRRTASVRNKKRARSRSDNEKESSENEEVNKKSKTDKADEIMTNSEDNTVEEKDEETLISASVNSNSENTADKSTENSDSDEQQDESVCLVLKRKGSSFTCIPKNNLESS